MHTVLSGDGEDFLGMIASWEKVRGVMREADDRFVRAKMLVDGHGYIFFFKYKNEIFGGNENARSVFSTMKRPMGEVGYEDMSFAATNLSKAMAGEPKEAIFVFKDVERIQVIPKEVAYKKLMRKKKEKQATDTHVGDRMRDIQRHQNDREAKSKDGRIVLNKDFEEM